MEILEFCFRDFGTYLGVTLWFLIIAYALRGFRLVEVNKIGGIKDCDSVANGVSDAPKEQ